MQDPISSESIAHFRQQLEDHPVYALEADLEARGLAALMDGIQVIDYDGFVELVEQHHVVPWL